MIAISAAFAVAVLAAIGLAILDLYLSGHGYADIRKETVSWPAAGIHLSIADIALLALAVAAAGLGWFLSRPRS